MGKVCLRADIHENYLEEMKIQLGKLGALQKRRVPM